MIEILTLVKQTDENGIVNYSINGSLPIDEAAKALVIVAANMERPKKEELASTQAPGQPSSA